MKIQGIFVGNIFFMHLQRMKGQKRITSSDQNKSSDNNIFKHRGQNLKY